MQRSDNAPHFPSSNLCDLFGFSRTSRSALMALLFLSNVWFFLNTGYFAGGADTMPLLHCWSLPCGRR